MEGGCHCGAIRFNATSSPFWVGACYCVDCRKISGAPYVVYAGYKKEEVHILKGTPKQYSSSENVWRSFCESCGSPFSYTYKNSSDKIFMYIGAFDDPSVFKLQKHIWTSQKLPWITINDDLPQREE
jgi:hypothetical protein